MTKRTRKKWAENTYISNERVDIWGRKHAWVVIEQCTKSFFVGTFQHEFSIAPVEVNGYNGFTMISKDGESPNVVIWGSRDYIHIVRGTLTTEELLEIVENMIELT